MASIGLRDEAEDDDKETTALDRPEEESEDTTEGVGFGADDDD